MAEVALAVAAGAGFAADFQKLCESFFGVYRRVKYFEPNMEELQRTLLAMTPVIRELDKDREFQIPESMRVIIRRDINEANRRLEQMKHDAGVKRFMKQVLANYERQIKKINSDLNAHIIQVNCILSCKIKIETAEIKGRVAEIKTRLGEINTAEIKEQLAEVKSRLWETDMAEIKARLEEINAAELDAKFGEIVDFMKQMRESNSQFNPHLIPLVPPEIAIDSEDDSEYEDAVSFEDGLSTDEVGNENQPEEAIFKLNLHCSACTTKIKNIITKAKGYHKLTFDWVRQWVNVEGAMDFKAVAERLRLKLRRNVQILPPGGNCDSDEDLGMSLSDGGGDYGGGKEMVDEEANLGEIDSEAEFAEQFSEAVSFLRLLIPELDQKPFISGCQSDIRTLVASIGSHSQVLSHLPRDIRADIQILLKLETTEALKAINTPSWNLMELFFAEKSLRHWGTQLKSYLEQLQVPELMAETERAQRLACVKAAATAMSKRHADGSLPFEDFNIVLEDQSGKKVMGSETDQRAIMMGLMLHTNAKQLIKAQNYQDALEVLTMGEEAFSLCDPKVIELVDNPSILQIDMVWCYFMLRDIDWLSVAGVRIEKAREGLERAHGKDSFCVRFLQAGRYPERVLYLRLDLLEGVVAYHSGQLDKSMKVLISAQEKFTQLQVPDESLSLVMSMGFRERDAKRALRMSNQDVSGAVDFLLEQKAKRAQIREDDIQRCNEIMEQKRYGTTPLKKAVDVEKLNQLVSIGFAKELVAEALRRNENDSEKALDDLTNTKTNSSIQQHLDSRTYKRQRPAVDASVEALVRMRFERALAAEALRGGGTRDQAIRRLLSRPAPNPTITTCQSEAIPVVDANNNSQDAFTDYDIEVTREGEAIREYLALLNSAGTK